MTPPAAGRHSSGTQENSRPAAPTLKCSLFQCRFQDATVGKIVLRYGAGENRSWVTLAPRARRFAPPLAAPTMGSLETSLTLARRGRGALHAPAGGLPTAPTGIRLLKPNGGRGALHAPAGGLPGRSRWQRDPAPDIAVDTSFVLTESMRRGAWQCARFCGWDARLR